MDTETLNAKIKEISPWTQSLRDEMGRVLVGQTHLVERLINSLLCNGHVLLEGVPGLAKTLAVKSLAGSLNVDFSRIQFTPDLLPADVLGTMVYRPNDGTFIEKLGPIFANIVLADEINRAPAKVQSALLEAMQENQVTLGENTHKLPNPFLVLATQNPIDQEGTYTLPEAQLDRFLFKVTVDYPDKEEELVILERMAASTPLEDTRPVVDPSVVLESRELVNQVFMDDALKKYIVELVHQTRNPSSADLKPLIRSGASPRATISLAMAAKANAFMQGRGFVLPQDIKDLAPDVLRHRLLLSYEAEAEELTSDQIIQSILSFTPVP